MKVCRFCGKPGMKIKRHGKVDYKTLCFRCYKNPWRRNKKEQCEICGFVPIHTEQLDVHHLDGNKKNNASSNLQTLCANCHRLITLMERGGLPTIFI
jgi:hypothetical protein